MNDALRQLQTLMCRDENGNLIKATMQQPPPRVETVRDSGPMMRAKMSQLELLGTIVRKKSGNDNIYSKGEVTRYDPINKLCTVKYQDGDGEEYDHSEIKRYKKPKQRYHSK